MRTQTSDLFKLVHFRPYPHHYSHLVVATKTRRQAGSTHSIRILSCCNCIDFASIKRGGMVDIFIPQQECIPVRCVPPTVVAVCWGDLPQCMLGYPPPRCGPGDPPGCGPGETCLKVWTWRPPRPHPSTSPLGVGLETCKACWDTTLPGDLQGMLGYLLQCMLGYHPPVTQNHRHV